MVLPTMCPLEIEMLKIRKIKNFSTIIPVSKGKYVKHKITHQNKYGMAWFSKISLVTQQYGGAAQLILPLIQMTRIFHQSRSLWSNSPPGCTFFCRNAVFGPILSSNYIQNIEETLRSDILKYRSGPIFLKMRIILVPKVLSA